MLKRSHLARVQRERKRRHWRRQKPRVRWMMDMGPRLGRAGARPEHTW